MSWKYFSINNWVEFKNNFTVSSFKTWYIHICIIIARPALWMSTPTNGNMMFMPVHKSFNNLPWMINLWFKWNWKLTKHYYYTNYCECYVVYIFNVPFIHVSICIFSKYAYHVVQIQSWFKARNIIHGMKDKPWWIVCLTCRNPYIVYLFPN